MYPIMIEIKIVIVAYSWYLKSYQSDKHEKLELFGVVGRFDYLEAIHRWIRQWMKIKFFRFGLLPRELPLCFETTKIM